MQVSSSARGGRKAAVFNEINITPLTDIFLVLLIIMMVVAPMMQQTNREIQPPKVANGTPVKQGQLTVEVTKDGGFFLEGRQVAAEGLTREFEAASGKLEEKNVVIRADKSTKSGAVMKVLEAARDAQYKKVTVAGESLSENRQRELQSGVDTPSDEQGEA